MVVDVGLLLVLLCAAGGLGRWDGVRSGDVWPRFFALLHGHFLNAILACGFPRARWYSAQLEFVQHNAIILPIQKHDLKNIMFFPT